MEIRYVYIFIILVIISFIYYRLAILFNIVDKPNYRSSHEIPTVRGGGILFPIASILWWVIMDFQYNWMLSGLLIISLISLTDDIKGVSKRVRILVQLLAISLMFYELEVLLFIPWWILPLLFILCLGIINAVNFMDGINGITGLYAMIFFGTLVIIRGWLDVSPFSLILYIAIAVFVFLFFNFRDKKALMFAGDIGSISIAFLLIFFLLKIYLESGNWTVILLLLVYGVDSVITILQRMVKKENIFKPHRTHLYQYLSNQMNIPHLWVSGLYAGIQLGLNYILFIRPQSLPNNIVAVTVIIITILIYVATKSWVLKKSIAI